MSLRKVLTVANVLNQNIDRVPFDNEFFEAYKQPQTKGVWFFWGTSGSGKSTHVVQVAKELAKTYKTFYNLLEEETDDSDFIERLERNKMQDVKDNFFTASYDYEQCCEYLDKRNSPHVIVIDSATYFFKDFDQYMEFKKKYKKKIIIITGHAETSKPRTQLEVDIMFDAKQKVFINGYLATCKGRTIGPKGTFIIWQEGYEKLRGEKSSKQ